MDVKMKFLHQDLDDLQVARGVPYKKVLYKLNQSLRHKFLKFSSSMM